VGYGFDESFAGAAGLSHFRAGLGTLLDALAATKARIVLLSPQRMEDKARPLPDPAAANRNLRLYADAIPDLAATRAVHFLDLYDLLNATSAPTARLTDNGIPLTAWGYWRTAPEIEAGLGLSQPVWNINIGALSKERAVNGAKVDEVHAPKGATLSFRVRDAAL